MKKNVYVNERGNEKGTKDLKSFTEEITWKCVSYYGGPEQHNRVLTSNGLGDTKYLYCTGGNCNGSELVANYLNEYHCDCIIWSDNSEKLTNDELIKLWNEYDIWYDVYTQDYNDGFYETVYVIYRGNDIPKYFVETKFTGPIDSEIDTYEEVIE